MKIRNLWQLMGFRSKGKRYGYAIEEFRLQDYGVVKYAQWLHPANSPVVFSQAAVDSYRAFVNPGDFCIDIGAYTGDSTLPIALSAGALGMTLALEPNPYVYPVLEKNARLNRKKACIMPMMAAAAENEGEIVFEYSDSGYCNGGRHKGISAFKHGHAYELPVHGVHLSKELRSDFSDWLPRLKFIKVDAEGYDLYIVRSIADIIEEFSPYMKVEVYKHTSSQYRFDLISFFKDRDYDAYKIEVEPCQCGVIINPSDANKWSHYDIFCAPKTPRRRPTDEPAT